jgi:hypothetical protein
MRRRYDADDVPPPELLVFEGFRHATDAAWGAAFDVFNEARERWRSQRELPVDALPPAVIDGECPFDPRSI